MFQRTVDYPDECAPGYHVESGEVVGDAFLIVRWEGFANPRLAYSTLWFISSTPHLVELPIISTINGGSTPPNSSR